MILEPKQVALNAAQSSRIPRNSPGAPAGIQGSADFKRAPCHGPDARCTSCSSRRTGICGSSVRRQVGVGPSSIEPFFVGFFGRVALFEQKIEKKWVYRSRGKRNNNWLRAGKMVCF